MNIFHKILTFFKKKKCYIDSGIDTHAITYIDPDDILPRYMSETERFWITQAIMQWNSEQLYYEVI